MQIFNSFSELASANSAPVQSQMSVFNATVPDFKDDPHYQFDTDDVIWQSVDVASDDGRKFWLALTKDNALCIEFSDGTQGLISVHANSHEAIQKGKSLLSDHYPELV